MNLKISQGVYAIEIKSQVNSTGFQVRTTCNVESDTIKSLFLLLCIALHDNRYKIEEDQKVSVLSDLQPKENTVIRMLRFGLPTFSSESSQIQIWYFEIQIQLSQATHRTRSNLLQKFLQILKDFSSPGHCGT